MLLLLASRVHLEPFHLRLKQTAIQHHNVLAEICQLNTLVSKASINWSLSVILCCGSSEAVLLSDFRHKALLLVRVVQKLKNSILENSSTVIVSQVTVAVLTVTPPKTGEEKKICDSALTRNHSLWQQDKSIFFTSRV